MVSSPELQRLIEEVIASDAVRTALARQSASFGSEVAGELRHRTQRIDDRIAVTDGTTPQHRRPTPACWAGSSPAPSTWH